MMNNEIKQNLSAKTNIIFVAGFPRSGTTWFSNLINSHANVIYRHELIGRNYTAFGDELFNKVKFDSGLIDDDYEDAMEVVRSADVDTDKPPFFQKDFGLAKFPKIHHTFWILTKFIPIFKPLYNSLFRVPVNHTNIKMLIKETRSLNNMESMLKSLRVSNIIFLIRVPHGAIASHLSGIQKGKMVAVSKNRKLRWFKEFEDNHYVKSLNYTSKDIEDMCSAEFFAINWRLYHLEVIRLKSVFPEANLCFYEKFVADTDLQTETLFEKIELAVTDDVKKFISQSSGESKNLKLDSKSEFYSVYRNKDFTADAWQKSLTDTQINAITRHTDDVYQQLKACS